jgi:hypothetical protein
MLACFLDHKKSIHACWFILEETCSSTKYGLKVLLRHDYERYIPIFFSFRNDSMLSREERGETKVR